MKFFYAAINAGCAAIVAVAIAVLALMLGACSPVHHSQHTRTIKKVAMVKWGSSPRCKIIGRASTSNVAVLVERNCLRNGVTTVNIIVLNKKKKGISAALDGVKLVTKLLGFKPKLTILFYGKAKGRPFFMCAVTGTNE